jgi:uncharacterized membrane protein
MSGIKHSLLPASWRMSKSEKIGAGVALTSWAILLFVFVKPASQFYKEVYPNKYGSLGKKRDMHRAELLFIASLLLIVGVGFLVASFYQ